MVRAAYGIPAISSSIYFLLANYLYQHPTILVKIFVGLDLCESCTRSLSMMGKLFSGSQHGLEEVHVKGVMDSQHFFYSKQ